MFIPISIIILFLIACIFPWQINLCLFVLFLLLAVCVFIVALFFVFPDLLGLIFYVGFIYFLFSVLEKNKGKWKKTKTT